MDKKLDKNYKKIMEVAPFKVRGLRRSMTVQLLFFSGVLSFCNFHQVFSPHFPLEYKLYDFTVVFTRFILEKIHFYFTEISDTHIVINRGISFYI